MIEKCMRIYSHTTKNPSVERKQVISRRSNSLLYYKNSNNGNLQIMCISVHVIHLNLEDRLESLITSFCIFGASLLLSVEESKRSPEIHRAHRLIKSCRITNCNWKSWRIRDPSMKNLMSWWIRSIPILAEWYGDNLKIHEIHQLNKLLVMLFESWQHHRSHGRFSRQTLSLVAGVVRWISKWSSIINREECWKWMWWCQVRLSRRAEVMAAAFLHMITRDIRW